MYDGRILSCYFYVDSFSVLFCFEVGSSLGLKIEVGSTLGLEIEVGSVGAVLGGMVVSLGRGFSLFLLEAFVDCLVSYLSVFVLLLCSEVGTPGTFAGAPGLGTLV